MKRSLNTGVEVDNSEVKKNQRHTTNKKPNMYKDIYNNNQYFGLVNYLCKHLVDTTAVVAPLSVIRHESAVGVWVCGCMGVFLQQLYKLRLD